jgi:hypothetical protein
MFRRINSRLQRNQDYEENARKINTFFMNMEIATNFEAVKLG